MKKTKKKLVASLVAIVLLLATAIGTTLAWFTDNTDSIQNSFTVGNVDIALYETNTSQAEAPETEVAANALTNTYQTVYLPASGRKILPTSVVDKFTYIVNYGDVNAYVGMTIAMPASLADDLTLALDTSAWTLNKTVTADEITTKSYVYNTALAPNAQTTALLSSITVNATAGKQFIADLAALAETNEISNDFSVVVTGYAIQQLGAGANSAEALNKGFSEVFNATNE